MAAPTVVKRGLASVEGVPGTLGVIVYPVTQSVKMTQNFDVEEIKDVHGFDAAWVARNEHQTFDLAMKILGDTFAHAKAGGVFLAPLATVTLTAFDLSIINGDYQVLPGADIDLGTSKVGDISFKLRKYANSDQATASTTTPA